LVLKQSVPNGISIIPAVYAQIPHAFQWDGQLPKIAPSLGGSGHHLIHGSLGPPESAPNGISISSAILRDQQTQRQATLLRL